MRPHYVREYSLEIEGFLVHLQKQKLNNIKPISIGFTKEDREIYAFEVKNSNGYPWALLTGSVHGNEPIGMQYLSGRLQYLKKYPYNFLVIPCVNPDGYSKGERHNANDIDINRDFSDSPKSKEASSVISFLKGRHFAVHIDIHESGQDESGEVPDNFYMWEINENLKTRKAYEVIEELYNSKIPTCNWNTIFGDNNRNGVIFYPEDCQSDEYKNAKTFDVFTYKFFSDVSVTTETCVHDPFLYRFETLDVIMRTYFMV